MTASDGRPDTHSEPSIVSPPTPCAYLPSKQSSYEVRVIARLSSFEYDSMLSRGWRRQGACFFRPACSNCDQCKSLRVDVPSFQPTKSQRRCWKRNRNVRVEIGRPTATPESIQLFNSYHAHMTERRGWRENQVEIDEFATHFLIGDFPFAREFRYFHRDRLVGVGLVDVTERSISSIYFFHDPAWRPMGPGVFSMLAELQHAQQASIEHHYLGYWIAACPSMAYKNRYRPHQLLDTYVTDEQRPVWMPTVAQPAQVSE